MVGPTSAGPRYDAKRPQPSSVPPPAWCMAAPTAVCYGETAEALFLTSGFVYDSAEQAEATFAGTVEHYQYSRFGNPTVAMLEARLAAIEGAEACRATATGMAAVHAALLSHLNAGDRVVAVARAVRLLPLDRLDAAAALRHRPPSSSTARDLAQWRDGARRAGATGAAGNPVQPDAGDRRSARGRARWRTRPARSSWWTTCSPRRCCSSRCNSAPMSSSIPAPSTSTARAACSAARCSAARLDRGDAAAVHPQHRPGAVAVQRLAAAEGPGDAGAARRCRLPRRRGRRRLPGRTQPEVARVWYPTRADHPQHALAMRADDGRRHGRHLRGGRRQAGRLRR